jgi:hypothetical protein
LSFREEAESPAYQRWAENESKAYIGFFLLTCIALGIFSDLSLGWWWLVVLPVGLFAASLLGGVFSILGRYLEHRGVLFLPSLLRLAGLVAVVGSTYLTLNALGN